MIFFMEFNVFADCRSGERTSSCAPQCGSDKFDDFGSIGNAIRLLVLVFKHDMSHSSHLSSHPMSRALDKMMWYDNDMMWYFYMFGQQHWTILDMFFFCGVNPLFWNVSHGEDWSWTGFSSVVQLDDSKEPLRWIHWIHSESKEELGLPICPFAPICHCGYWLSVPRW